MAQRTSHLPSKPCAVCGRPFAWRRKRAAVWSQGRGCSERCWRARRNRRRAHG